MKVSHSLVAFGWLVALSLQGPTPAQAQNPRPVDLCDYQGMASLLHAHDVTDPLLNNSGATENLTDAEERQDTKQTSLFSSTQAAENCLKELLKKGGRIDGPAGKYITGTIQQDKNKKSNLYKLINYNNGQMVAIEMKVKGDPNGDFSVLKKGLFDKKFKLKGKELQSLGAGKKKFEIHTARFCGEKNWTLEKFEKEKKKCDDKFKTHTWSEEICECKTDDKKVTPCANGKMMTNDERLAAKDKCEKPNSDPSSRKLYEYNLTTCECTDTKKLHDCGPNFGQIGLGEYERKKKYCEVLIKIDPRRTWREASCDCPPVPRIKEKPEYCGKIKLKHPGHKEELKARCEKKYGDPTAWNGTDCTCTDPCYTYTPNEDRKRETCDIKVLQMDGNWLGEVSGKVCEQPYDNEKLLQSLKDQAIEHCKNEVKAEVAKLDADQVTTAFDKVHTTQYVHPSGIVCSTSSLSVATKSEVGEYFPDNVPTLDLNKFSGDCQKGYTLNDAALGAYRIHDGKKTQDILTCSDVNDNNYENIKQGNQALKNQAKDMVDRYMSQLKLSKPVTREQLDEALKNAKINLNVMGTANRNNNNTAKTLDELAQMRKSEAERLMMDEIRAQFGSYLGDSAGAYQIPEASFVKKGVSKAVGPLSPEYPYSGSYGEVCEEGDPLLKDCCSKYMNPFQSSELYKCSVNQFFDKECPSLASSNPELHGRVCSDAENRKKLYLNAVKGGFYEDGRAKVDPKVIADFNALKLFDVAASIEAPDKKAENVDQPKIDVTCRGRVSPVKETQFNDIPVYDLKIKKPGILRRLKKDCRNEKKLIRSEVDSEFGEGTFKKLMKEGEINDIEPKAK